MAFKNLQQPTITPDSPEKLFRDLHRRKYPDVLPHQSEMLKRYSSTSVLQPDVALQLPTGSGKTLVGLLIAEWRRRKFNERVVYLCPTKQLVNQTFEQGTEKYGLSLVAFTGNGKEYLSSDKTDYMSANKVAITTYSSLFNTNPYFDSADVLILDDAHASEGYISSLWALKVERNNEKHTTLHSAICNILKRILKPLDYSRLTGQIEDFTDFDWIDKIPGPSLYEIYDELIEVFDANVKSAELQFAWSTLKDNLHSCQFYISSNEILIRPLISPTWTHSPFISPKQRIYMSATLGGGGDLERIVGRKSIHRLQAPEGWDLQGVGRRFFIFPELSHDDESVEKLRLDLIEKAGRSLILVPTDYSKDLLLEKLDNKGFKLFDIKSIEQSKAPFISEPKAIVVASNRYDGIDFAADECRLLFIEGLPKATNLQERFIMTKMGATALYNERIRTRVLQAIGRCTRSLEDYSAVVISGNDLSDYLLDKRKQKYFHPELQAELIFGVEQSREVDLASLSANFDIFLRNDSEWDRANQEIVKLRNELNQEMFPFMENLKNSVSHEINFQEQFWKRDFIEALSAAETVISQLTSNELQGYRALWHYLAGCAAWFVEKESNITLKSKALMHFSHAKKATIAIPWLANIGLENREENATILIEPVMEQIERLEKILSKLGTTHDRDFAKREKEILEGINSSKYFENAHKMLGELLGFTAGKIENNASPDPWWISGNYCFVFEDHADAKATSELSPTKARQVASHPNWMKMNVKECQGTEIIPILISPVQKISEGSLPHINEVYFWPLNDFKNWVIEVVGTIRDVRKTFFENGDINWRVSTAEIFKQQGLDAKGLFERFKKDIGQHNLIVV